MSACCRFPSLPSNVFFFFLFVRTIAGKSKYKTSVPTNSDTKQTNNFPSSDDPVHKNSSILKLKPTTVQKMDTAQHRHSSTSIEGTLRSLSRLCAKVCMCTLSLTSQNHVARRKKQERRRIQKFGNTDQN